MSSKGKVTATGGTDNQKLNTTVRTALMGFRKSLDKVANGATFTVNAPKGITISGNYYESGSQAPIVNAKLCGWSIAAELLNGHTRTIAEWVATNDGVAEALTEASGDVTRGYSHADRATALIALATIGKPVTKRELCDAVDTARGKRKGNGGDSTGEISDDDLLGSF